MKTERAELINILAERTHLGEISWKDQGILGDMHSWFTNLNGFEIRFLQVRKDKGPDIGGETYVTISFGEISWSVSRTDLVKSPYMINPIMYLGAVLEGKNMKKNLTLEEMIEKLEC